MTAAPAYDPIVFFAERAQTRAYLWAVGEMRFRAAFDPLLSDGVRDGLVEAEQVCRSCGSIICINPGFCARCLAADAKFAPPPWPLPRRGAARSTCDAVLHELRTHGVARLAEPRCRQRLAELSADQVRELVAALTRLRPQCPAISEELLARVGKRS